MSHTTACEFINETHKFWLSKKVENYVYTVGQNKTTAIVNQSINLLIHNFSSHKPQKMCNCRISYLYYVSAK